MNGFRLGSIPLHPATLSFTKVLGGSVDRPPNVMKFILDIIETQKLECMLKAWREELTDTLANIINELCEDERANSYIIEEPEENGYVNEAEYNFDDNELTVWMPCSNGLVQFVIELNDEERELYKKRIKEVSDFRFCLD